MKIALKVIERMRPDYARRSLKRRAWSKTKEWFDKKGMPSPFAAGQGGPPSKGVGGCWGRYLLFRNSADGRACEREFLRIADALGVSPVTYAYSLRTCTDSEIRAALKKAARSRNR